MFAKVALARFQDLCHWVTLQLQTEQTSTSTCTPLITYRDIVEGDKLPRITCSPAHYLEGRRDYTQAGIANLFSAMPLHPCMHGSRPLNTPASSNLKDQLRQGRRHCLSWSSQVKILSLLRRWKMWWPSLIHGFWLKLCGAFSEQQMVGFCLPKPQYYYDAVEDSKIHHHMGLL